MKPILFKHSEAIKDPFFVLHERTAHFYDTLHYHPEFQLTLITEGVGTFFIADHIERFGPGDIFIIGPDLPHVFRSDNEYYRKNASLRSEYTSAYFTLSSFGADFFNIPDNAVIKAFLAEASRGMKLNGEAAKRLSPAIHDLFRMKGVKKIAAFLLILDEMASAPKKEKQSLSSLGFIGASRQNDNDRMSQVFDYVMENFTKDINLEDVAAKACMTNTAFCRFFKKRTRKTLVQFITEARIGYACKLLLEERYTVSEIAYKSGFKNISNFNRQFKTITGKTPLHYLGLFRTKQLPAA